MSILVESKKKVNTELRNKLYLHWICINHKTPCPLAFEHNYTFSSLPNHPGSIREIARITGLHRNTITNALMDLEKWGLAENRNGTWIAKEPPVEIMADGEVLSPKSWFYPIPSEKSQWWNKLLFLPIYKTTLDLTTKENALRWAIYKMYDPARKHEINYYAKVLGISKKSIRTFVKKLRDLGIVHPEEWKVIDIKINSTIDKQKANDGVEPYILEDFTDYEFQFCNSKQEIKEQIIDFNNMLQSHAKLTYTKGQIKHYWKQTYSLFKGQNVQLLDAFIFHLPYLAYVIGKEAQTGALAPYKTKFMVNHLKKAWAVDKTQFLNGMFRMELDHLSYKPQKA